MTIEFVYYYLVVCAKCGRKITDIQPAVNSSSGHIFSIDSQRSCSGCGESKEFNIISSVVKIFKDEY